MVDQTKQPVREATRPRGATGALLPGRLLRCSAAHGFWATRLGPYGLHGKGIQGRVCPVCQAVKEFFQAIGP